MQFEDVTDHIHVAFEQHLQYSQVAPKLKPRSITPRQMEIRDVTFLCGRMSLCYVQPAF
jgi:hypothetical protein